MNREFGNYQVASKPKPTRRFKNGVGTALATLALGAASLTFAAENYFYDDLGRLTEVVLDDGTTIKYEYDPAGNRTEVETIIGAPPNDPPTANTDSATTNEDQAITISPIANDTDPQNQILSLSSVGPGSKGSTAISGNNVVYTPNANATGADSFVYEVSDGQFESGGTVNVTITAVNDLPNAVNDSISTNEDTQHTFNPRSNDSDIETASSALVITARTNGSKGSVAIINSGTQLRYTPNANANGADSFTYTIRDAANATDTATVSVSIAPINDPPNAVNDSRTTNEDVQTTFDPRTNDTDADGQTLTITASTTGSKGTVSIIGGTQLRYTPFPNTNGSDSFSYTISDGTVSDTATVSMTVNAVNDPPNAVNDTYNNVARNQWVTFNVLSNDSDIEGSYAVTSIGSTFGGTVQIINSGSQVRFLSSSPPMTQASFDYTITDSGGFSDTASVTVNFAGGGGFPNF
ncbi:MAG: Ig-like domain-containing protein [Pseudomonadota bacterium]